MSELMLSDISTYISSSLGGTTISLGYMAAVPVVQVALYEYAGRGPDYPKTDRPGLQVMARGTNYATVRAMMQTIEDLLIDVQNTMIAGTFYLNIEPVQSVIPMGWDNGAVKLAQNYMIERAR